MQEQSGCHCMPFNSWKHRSVPSTDWAFSVPEQLVCSSENDWTLTICTYTIILITNYICLLYAEIRFCRENQVSLDNLRLNCFVLIIYGPFFKVTNVAVTVSYETLEKAEKQFRAIKISAVYINIFLKMIEHLFVASQSLKLICFSDAQKAMTIPWW